MKQREIEVLAPAGSMECLEAAILNGADAVYLGGHLFGARAYANNFGQEELCKAIDYVHLYGKKIFLTVNTLVKEKERQDFLEFLIPYYEQGLDGAIIQDPGALRMVREHFPGLEIHGSTQMTITGVHGAKLLKKMGAKRVVPARELSLEEIKEIKDETGLDIECFVHGALCYCYSGQCFMSSMLGGRSGNRGRCAGTCRLPFSERRDGQHSCYPLSLKDLCTIEQLPDILDHGVDSLKIEGRMKGARYVGEVTRIYRKYVDLYQSDQEYRVEPEDKKILMELFNRGGFTDGYYKNYHGRPMMSLDRPGHQGIFVGKVQNIRKGTLSFVTKEALHKGDVLEIQISNAETVALTSPSDWEKGSYVTLNGKKLGQMSKGMEIFRTRNERLIQDIEKRYQEKKKEKLKGKFILSIGKCAKLIVENHEIAVEAEGPVIDQAKNHSADAQSISKQLRKTGETHYEFEELKVEMDPDIFVPGSVLKKLRREAFLRLDEEKILRYRRKYEPKKKEKSFEDKSIRWKKPELTVSLEDLKLLSVALSEDQVRKVYISWMQLKQQKNPEEMIRQIAVSGKECYIMLPQIARKKQIRELEEKKTLIFSENVKGFLVRNLEEYEWLLENDCNKEMVLDYMMYGYNKKAVSEYQQYAAGEIRMTYPEECNLQEMEDLHLLEADLMIYGYLPLMVSVQCIKDNLHQCDGKEQWLTIYDRYRKKFFVHSCCSDCVNEIYNGQPLWLGDETEALCHLHPKTYRIHLTKETPKEAAKILEAAKKVIEGKSESLGKEITKGHFRRGAL